MAPLQPRSTAVCALRDLEARYASLAGAAHFKGSRLTQDAVALDLVVSLLFTAITRVSRGEAGGRGGCWRAS
jgi:hypothetical protein